MFLCDENTYTHRSFTFVISSIATKHALFLGILIKFPS